ncbi:MAG TPA: universal stress protein [Burkholderiales bacterium]|nr:universal stress protein [Burkholderiales bacterium]
MRYLIPVGSSEAALPTVDLLEAAASRGVKVEVVLLNVQPAYNRRVSRFVSRARRDSFRASSSRAAMAGMIERLSRAGICHRARIEFGSLTERIATVAEAERVDRILLGVGPQSKWLQWLIPSIPQILAARTNVPLTLVARSGESSFDRYFVPAGVAGIALLAGLLLAAG